MLRKALLAAVLVCSLSAIAVAEEMAGSLSLKPGDSPALLSFYKRSYALVIGIDGYRNGWPRLSNAIRDAVEVAVTLDSQGFAVTQVLDPDYNKLIEAITSFVFEQGSDPDARLVIWFAGHGHAIVSSCIELAESKVGEVAEADCEQVNSALRTVGLFETPQTTTP